MSSCKERRLTDHHSSETLYTYILFCRLDELKTHLELVLIKDPDQILWYQLKEPLKHKSIRDLSLTPVLPLLKQKTHETTFYLLEGTHLFLYSVHKPPLNHQAVNHKTADQHQTTFTHRRRKKKNFFSYWMYSSLVSLVTTISEPPGFKSCWWVWTDGVRNETSETKWHHNLNIGTKIKMLSKPVQTALHQWWISCPSLLDRSPKSTSGSWNTHCPKKVGKKKHI